HVGSAPVSAAPPVHEAAGRRDCRQAGRAKQGDLGGGADCSPLSRKRRRSFAGCPGGAGPLPWSRFEAREALEHPLDTRLPRPMALAPQTVALLAAARQLVQSLPADAVLLMTETDLDWGVVRAHLGDCKLLVAAEDRELTSQFKENP